jgi:hypothetical protein
MTPHFRLRKLTNYPEWHKKPFLLNRAEMVDPYAVLFEFFDRYDLGNIRIALKQWLDDAINAMETEAASHFYTYENVAKLAEAAWVIVEQRKQAIADAGFADTIEDEESDEEEAKDDEKMERSRFVKWTNFPASLKATPIVYMKQIFEVMDLDGLSDTINCWQKIALAADYGRYDEAGERSDLMDYCEGLSRLVEAAYILQRKMEWETEGRVKRELSESITLDLLTEEQTFQLSDQEMSNTPAVIANFFEVFNPAYARRELWDMLACVVESRQEGLRRLDLLLDYECLYAVLEATWLLHIQSRETITTVEYKTPAL